MKNIIQMQDDLKNIPDNTLITYMQNPTSTMQGMLGMLVRRTHTSPLADVRRLAR